MSYSGPITDSGLPRVEEEQGREAGEKEYRAGVVPLQGLIIHDIREMIAAKFRSKSSATRSSVSVPPQPHVGAQGQTHN